MATIRHLQSDAVSTVPASVDNIELGLRSAALLPIGQQMTFVS